MQMKFVRILYGTKPKYRWHELFEERSVLSVNEFYCFELIKFSLEALRQETRNSQKSLLATLKCENKYHKTSLELRGTKVMNVLLKRDLIAPKSLSSLTSQIVLRSSASSLY